MKHQPRVLLFFCISHADFCDVNEEETVLILDWHGCRELHPSSYFASRRLCERWPSGTCAGQVVDGGTACAARGRGSALLTNRCFHLFCSSSQDNVFISLYELKVTWLKSDPSDTQRSTRFTKSVTSFTDAAAPPGGHRAALGASVTAAQRNI